MTDASPLSPVASIPPIRILSLEDMPSDAELIYAILKRAGLTFDWRWACNEAEFLAALSDFQPTLILTDYSLPGYDGASALLRVMETSPMTPVIVVTGALGEEVAVHLLKNGAVDYILKDRMARLPDAVARALSNAEALRVQHEAQARLIESESLLQQAQEIAHLGSWRWEQANNQIYCSAEAYRIFGRPEDAAGQEPHAFILQVIAPEDADLVWQQMEAAWKGENACECEARVRRPDGEVRWIHGQAKRIYNSAGVVIRLVGTLLDITERKLNEDRIRHLAQHDSLTGLPNREHLYLHMRGLIHSARRNRSHFAVMFLDIDHFKNINDTLGHHIGDMLLVAFSRRLVEIVRQEDTVARLGGDEFVLLFPSAHVEDAAGIAGKLMQQLSIPFQLAQHEIRVTGSIGIALYPNDGEDVDQLMRHADTAMYRSKEGGRNSYHFFTPKMQLGAVRNMQLLGGLSHALERAQLRVVFQPQFDLKANRIVGAEALLRWHHPELGEVAPSEFISVAETSGLILPLGAWVMREAIRQARRWHQQGHQEVSVAVNLSLVQFRQENLVQLVGQILQEEGMDARYLELELTESIAMHDPETVVELIRALHALGVRLSIDDFGTGYSSLSYLKRFRVDKLKIDQSFVQDLCVDPEDHAIVNTIIQLAKNLGCITIAEGVETIEQQQILQELGCEEVQGYLISRPVAAEQFVELLNRFRRNVG